MALNKEGTVALRLNHEHKDWSTNQHAYQWSGNTGGVSYEATKHPNGMFQASFNVPQADRDFAFIVPRVPKCDQRGLFVEIIWREKEINIFLNGKVVQTLKEWGSDFIGGHGPLV